MNLLTLVRKTMHNNPVDQRLHIFSCCVAWWDGVTCRHYRAGKFPSFLPLDAAISEQNMFVIGTTLTTICMAMENFPSLDTAQSFSASNMKWQQENSSLETYKENMKF